MNRERILQLLEGGAKLHLGEIYEGLGADSPELANELMDEVYTMMLAGDLHLEFVPEVEWGDWRYSIPKPVDLLTAEHKAFLAGFKACSDMAGYRVCSAEGINDEAAEKAWRSYCLDLMVETSEELGLYDE